MLAIGFDLAFPKARNGTKFRQGARTLPAERVQRRVVHHDKCGDPLFSRNRATPLAQVFAQLVLFGGEQGRLWNCWNNHSGTAAARARAGGGNTHVHPFWLRAANIARATGIPFWSLTEMHTDLAVAAAFALREGADVMVSLPGAIG